MRFIPNIEDLIKIEVFCSDNIYKKFYSRINGSLNLTLRVSWELMWVELITE